MSTETTEHESVPRLPLKFAVLCFAVLGGSYVVNAVDRQVFSMLLPFVMKEYHFPLQSGGLLVSIFTLGIGLAGIPAGYLMARLSRKAVMMIAITIYSIFTILTAYASGFNDMLLCRTATGLGEGMQMAALYAACGAYFPKRRTLIFALLSVFFGVGNFTGPLIAGKVLETHDWRDPLILFGLAGLVFVALIAIVPKSFTEHRDRSADEFAVDDFPKERVWNRNLFFVAIAASCFGLSQYAFLSMYPTFLSGSLHYAPSSIGYTMSLFGLGGILALPIGFLGDRLKQKWIVLAALVGCAVVGYLIFNVAAAPGHHAILSCMLGFSGASFIANASSLMQRCVPNIHIGKASGIFVTSTYIPASFSGYLFGVLVGSLDWGGAALVQLTIIPLIGAASLLLINDRHGATRADAIVGEDSVKPAKGKRPLKAIAVSSVP